MVPAIETATEIVTETANATGMVAAAAAAVADVTKIMVRGSGTTKATATMIHGPSDDTEMPHSFTFPANTQWFVGVYGTSTSSSTSSPYAKGKKGIALALTQSLSTPSIRITTRSTNAEGDFSAILNNGCRSTLSADGTQCFPRAGLTIDKLALLIGGRNNICEAFGGKAVSGRTSSIFFWLLYASSSVW